LLPFSGRHSTANSRAIKARAPDGAGAGGGFVKVKVARYLLAIAASQLPLAHLFSSTWAESQKGIAAVYSLASGGRTASGQKLNPEDLTAAHRTLPFGTKVKVTNKKNGLSVIVTINDRGPFTRGRIIDLTPAAARVLGFTSLARVTLDIEG
jgi:rare lipoprotein A